MRQTSPLKAIDHDLHQKRKGKNEQIHNDQAKTAFENTRTIRPKKISMRELGVERLRHSEYLPAGLRLLHFQILEDRRDFAFILRQSGHQLRPPLRFISRRIFGPKNSSL